VVGSVPVTGPARTVADLAASVGAGFLARLVDNSLRRRITTLPELRAVVDMRRIPSLRDILDARQPGYHPGDSDREVDLARVLVEAGLPRPVPQHQVAVGGTVYLLDLAYPDARDFPPWAGNVRDGCDRVAADGDRAAADS